ncbi:MAG: hypothetical protein AAGA92_14020, partial [Planctomycetota bacterium]
GRRPCYAGPAAAADAAWAGGGGGAPGGPPPPPTAGVECRPYACKGCGSVYFGEFNRACQGQYCGRERAVCSSDYCDNLQQHRLGLRVLPPSGEQHYTLQKVQAVLSGEYSGPERRAAERLRMNARVLVLPLDVSFRVIGRPFRAIARDLSTDGVRLRLGRSTQADRYVVDFMPHQVEGLRMVTTVVWESEEAGIKTVGSVFCGSLDPSLGSLATFGA